MYDPFAPPQLPPPGQMQTTAVPQQVGMVPGVPGSVGLNPGAGGPIHGQQNPGPMMYPGGPSHNNAFASVMQSPEFQALAQSAQGQALLQAYPQLGRYFSPGAASGGNAAMQDWRALRPDRPGFAGPDWRGAMQDWRSQRPGMSPQPVAPTPTPTPVTGAPVDPARPPHVMEPTRMWNVPGAGTLSSPRRGPGGGSGF